MISSILELIIGWMVDCGCFLVPIEPDENKKLNEISFFSLKRLKSSVTHIFLAPNH